MNENQNFDFIDILTIFSIVIQMLGYQENKKQSTNDDLMKELQKQDREYLDKIIENQKLILEKLAELG